MKPRDSIAIDVFAGCGGLSLGLKAAGFDVRVAVEIDKLAAETYRANHRDTLLIESDICEVDADAILDRCGGPVTLIAGCAPCQGFCSLTAKNKREDPRNRLVLEMLRLIKGIKPSVVLMENVPGLAKRGASIFQCFIRELQSLGYVTEWQIVQMADYGVPQSRRRLVLLAGRGFNIALPPTSQRKGDSKHPWKTLREVVGGMPRPVSLIESWKDGGPRRHNWHVVRDLQPQTRKRLEAATPGKTWLTVDDALRPECHRNGYDGFTNVYGRMSWDQTPVTMTAGCTTPCKGRFGHPDKRRTTISVREAALIQTFPKRYKFETDFIDQACDMIGNAVPPLFATKVARQVLRAIAENESLARRR